MRHVRPALFAAALAVALSACAEAASLPERPPDASGTIADLMPRAGDVDQAIVEPQDNGAQHYTFTLSDTAEGDYYYDAQMGVGADTMLMDNDGRLLSRSALLDGLAVDVWVDACAESYPVQCEVTHLLITGDGT